MGQYGFLIIMAVLLIVMMWFSSRSRKKMQQQQQEQKRLLDEGLVPGVWARTAIGFWGRYVDQDGEVVILETPDGTETYWDRSAIRSVGEPPFASEEPAAPLEDAPQEPEKPVLGLGSPDAGPDTPATPPETDEDDQKH